MVSVSFDNGSDRRNENTRVILAPGQEETVVVNSPLQGTQSFEVAITPPYKRVEQFREVEVPFKVYEKLWQMSRAR